MWTLTSFTVFQYSIEGKCYGKDNIQYFTFFKCSINQEICFLSVFSLISLTELVTKVYQRKQKQVVLHVLPLLWHLLGATNSSGAVQGGSSSIRTATATLVNSLHNQMGGALLEKATTDPNVTPRHLQLLQEMVER